MILGCSKWISACWTRHLAVVCMASQLPEQLSETVTWSVGVNSNRDSTIQVTSSCYIMSRRLTRLGVCVLWFRQAAPAIDLQPSFGRHAREATTRGIIAT